MSQRARAREIAPGLTRFSLTGPSGLVVHSWLIETGTTAVLVDSGFTHTAEDLIGLLDASGYELEALDGVLVTHTHEDHLGGAVVAAHHLRAPVYVREGTLPATDNFYGYYAARPWLPWLESLLPDGERRSMILTARSNYVRHAPPLEQGGDGTLPEVVEVPIGGQIQLGDLRFECHDTRGHDPFHVAWYEPTHGWLFTGDVLLGVPTPIVPPMDDDLGDYRESLCRLGQLERKVSLILPGHGAHGASLPRFVERSRAQVRSLYDTVRFGFSDGSPVDPAGIALAAAGARSARKLARGLVLLANVHSQLLEMSALGYVAVDAGRYWHQRRPWPEYGDLFERDDRRVLDVRD